MGIINKIKFLSSILFIVTVINITNADWVPVSNGMENKLVFSLVGSGNYLFAGTLNYGVYISTNNGGNWSQTSLNFQRVYALAANGSYIYAGCAFLSGGLQANFVFISSNYGTSWSPPNQYQGYNVISVAVNGNYIFAGSPGTTSGGVYLSTNNGTNWIFGSWINNSVPSLLVKGNDVFAGTGSAGVYLSSNNGISWNQTSLNNRNVKSLAANGNNIFAGTTDYGVYISTDNGSNWVQTSLNNQSVISLAVIGSNVFAGTFDYGIFLSTNNGTSWTQRNEGLGSDTVYALCILNNYIFAGTGQTVWRRPLSEITDIKQFNQKIPSEFSLSQNYPNPFNPSTSINFSIPKSSYVVLKVYDVTSKEIKELANEQLNIGNYSVDFDGSDLSSGVYIYRLETENFTAAKKMVLIK